MRERTKELAVIIIICILFITFVFPVFTPPTRLNCKLKELNIKTGQIRISRYLCFIRYSQKLRDTAVSELIKEPIEFEDVQAWWPLSCFGPFRSYSPKYVFSTIFSKDVKESSIEDNTKTIDEKSEIAIGLMKKWQTYAFELTQEK